MEALNLTEGVNEKLDLILLKLISLDSKMKTDKELLMENFHTWKRMLNLWTNKS